jgi:hypothetical protein
MVASMEAIMRSYALAMQLTTGLVCLVGTLLSTPAADPAAQQLI